MSSAVWSIATIKKSILFDVLGVIDRANKTISRKIVTYDYALLKEETVKKYDNIYRKAINQSEILIPAFYVPSKNSGQERFTVLYEYLIDIAFEKTSFADLLDSISKSDRSEMGYYIAAKCLSTVEKEVTINDIAQLVDDDMSLIDFLHKFSIPEKIKMNIYLMIYYYDDFVKTLIKYLNDVHNLILELYNDLCFVFYKIESMLNVRLKDKKQRFKLLSSIGRRVKTEDDFKYKQIIILSLVRLEYCWMKFETKHVFYLTGLFFLQRLMHDNEFELF